MTRATDIRVDGVTLLNCVGKGLKAQGYESNQGFVVKANSQASLEVTASMQQQMHSIVDLRQDLIANEVCSKLVIAMFFNKTIVFLAHPLRQRLS